jgi:hypothetical protein
MRRFMPSDFREECNISGCCDGGGGGNGEPAAGAGASARGVGGWLPEPLRCAGWPAAAAAAAAAATAADGAAAAAQQRTTGTSIERVARMGRWSKACTCGMEADADVTACGDGGESDRQ